MAFEIQVLGGMPLTSSDDLDEVAVNLLTQIGYFPKKYSSEGTTESLKKSIPYRLFMDYFLRRADRGWLVEELAMELETTKPTVYRHINKLKSLDLLEEVTVTDEETGQDKKGYRLRYGNMSKAWSFVEAHVEMAMENYRKTVDHLQELVSSKQRKR